MLALLSGWASKAWGWLALAGAVIGAAMMFWSKARKEGRRDAEREIEERDREARRTRRDVEAAVRSAGDGELDDWLRPPGRRDD